MTSFLWRWHGSDGSTYTASSVCHVWAGEIYCNRCEGTCLEADSLSSLSQSNYVIKDMQGNQCPRWLVLPATSPSQKTIISACCWSHLGSICPVASVWIVVFLPHRLQGLITALKFGAENNQSSLNNGRRQVDIDPWQTE